jgi:hypothetical protein
MDEQNDRDQPQSRVKKGSNTFSYIAVVLVVLSVIGLYFYIQKSPSTSSINHAKNMEDEQSSQSSAQPEEGLPYSAVDGLMNKQPINAVNSPVPREGTQADSLAPTASKDISDQIKQRLSAGSNHQHLIDEINSFYAYLDQQPYMQSFGLKESSRVHFSKLLQKLVDNPPVVIRETDDLFTLLQNTAHFFRILGKENINIIKGILDREKNSFEQILKTFYGLTYQQGYLKKEYSLSIPPKILTDYAAFFLNTMGGRLYLFRRDSTSRMVVSYYAIISIDRANSEGSGGHGIDLRPAIHSLVEEIENGGRRLQLKEEYLDTLYDLQEKYN